MRDSKEKAPTVVPPSTAAYCVNDAQNTTPLFYFSKASGIGIQHLSALEDLFQLTSRFDRLQIILHEMVMERTVDNYGVWPDELSDMEDFMVLGRFLSNCHRAPTPTELQGFLEE